MKEVRYEIKTIALYLYRKVLLNEEITKYKISAEFCVSVLIMLTADIE